MTSNVNGLHITNYRDYQSGLKNRTQIYLLSVSKLLKYKDEGK